MFSLRSRTTIQRRGRSGRSLAPILFQGPVSEGSLTTAAAAAEMPLSTCEDEEEEEEASKVPTGGPPPGTHTAAPEQAVTFVSAPPASSVAHRRQRGQHPETGAATSFPGANAHPACQSTKGAGGGAGGTNFSSFHGGSMAEGQGSRYLSQPCYLLACPRRTLSGRMARAGRGCWEEGAGAAPLLGTGLRGDASFRRGVRASVDVLGRMTVVGKKGF